MTRLDTSCHERRRAARLEDDEFRREYERARAEIDQVDAVIRQLDDLRVQAGMSKAELARRVGKNPATLRRLLTADVNPELKTIAALAVALDAEVQIVPRRSRQAQPKKEQNTVV